MKYQRLQLTWHRLLAQISMPWSSWIMGPKLGHFGVKCSTWVAVRSYGLRLRTRPPLKPLWVRGGRGERGLIRSSRFHRVTAVCTAPWKEHVKVLASIPEKKEPLLQDKPEPLPSLSYRALFLSIEFIDGSCIHASVWGSVREHHNSIFNGAHGARKWGTFTQALCLAYRCVRILYSARFAPGDVAECENLRDNCR